MNGNSEKDAVYFGKTNFRNAERLFGIKRTDRRQHMYVVGKTGTGKTTLMHNLMVQDIANGEGVCVIDPHGEFVEGLLQRIPEHRKDDVVYFNPADQDSSVGFNVLELPDSRYKHLVASGLMGIFTKIWAGTWSARMEYILNNCILALLDTPGTTLLGITRLLVDKEYRGKIIGNVKDPVVRAFWTHEYEEWRDQFRNEAIAPIQNKVGQFLSTALIRNIVGQSKSTIHIPEIMNSGKIFLVNLSKGRIGEDNSGLLGGMLITSMQLSAMERVRIPEDERVDFFLYVDEFQNFATDSFANILSEARKYRLALILAHQYVGQLVTDTSTRVKDAIFGNVGTMIVFRVGAADAEFLEAEFGPEFTVMDMVNIPNRAIYLKLMVNGVSSRPFSANTLPPLKGPKDAADSAEVIEASRKRYARPRWLVEQEINTWSGMEGLGSSGGPGSGQGFRGGGQQDGGKFENEGYTRLPQRQEYHEDLAALGIEFGVKAGAPAPGGPRKFVPRQPREGFAPRPQGPRPPFRAPNEGPMLPRPPSSREQQDYGRTSPPRPVPSRPPAPRPSTPTEEAPPKGPAISLKDLANQPAPEPTKRGAPQEVDELKSALEDVLKNLE